jgi:hypothetical protein
MTPPEQQHCGLEGICRLYFGRNDDYPCRGIRWDLADEPKCSSDTRTHPMPVGDAPNYIEQIRSHANTLSEIITLEPATAKTLTRIEGEMWDLALKMDTYQKEHDAQVAAEAVEAYKKEISTGQEPLYTAGMVKNRIDYAIAEDRKRPRPPCEECVWMKEAKDARERENRRVLNELMFFLDGYRPTKRLLEIFTKIQSLRTQNEPERREE